MTVTNYRNWGRMKIRYLHGCSIIVERCYDCNCINTGNYSEPGVEKLIEFIISVVNKVVCSSAILIQGV